MMQLSDNIKNLKGVGEQRTKVLSRLGITTVRELMSYFPRAYEDRSNITPIAELEAGQAACISAQLTNEPTLSRVRRGLDIVRFRVSDETASLNITFFNKYLILIYLSSHDF